MPKHNTNKKISTNKILFGRVQKIVPAKTPEVVYDLEIEDNHNFFAEDILVHNCHHCNDIDKTYGKTLTYLAAPIKFGLTATLPESPKERMHLEALIGPMIAEFTVQEAIEKGILSKPTIHLIKVPTLPNFTLLDEDTVPIPDNKINDPDYKPTKYRVVYWNGIVTNMTRNMMIIDIADEQRHKGNSTLISVVNREHGEVLSDVAEDYYEWEYGKEFVFIHGGTPNKERKEIKERFKAKKLKMVIATVVWNEGITIASLNTCIIASGGRGKNATVQKIGRSLGKIKGVKETVDIYDFQDTCHKYLIDQFKARYKVFTDNDWL